MRPEWLTLKLQKQALSKTDVAVSPLCDVGLTETGSVSEGSSRKSRMRRREPVWLSGKA